MLGLKERYSVTLRSSLEFMVEILEVVETNHYRFNFWTIEVEIGSN